MGTGYEVDSWVAARFEVGIVDEPKNLCSSFQDEDAAQAQCRRDGSRIRCA
jgi:hypothetical protein